MDGEQKIKILVVDDEKSVREIVADLLELEDYDVQTADSGDGALQMLAGEFFDVLITDLMMDGIDGITLTKMVRNRGLDIPIVVMTGFGTIETAVESMKAGAWEFITKPFHNEQIIMTVEKVLETQRLRERASQREHFENLSRIDAMTGISNYRAIMETLANELLRSERYSHPLSLLMLDIDDFKDCNDTYGHLTGDQILKDVAAVIEKNIRGYDFAARYGGEEFLVVLPETPAAEAFNVAERVRCAIYGHAFNGENSTLLGNPLSVTIGIASFPEDGATEKELIGSADRALYRGKATGKNRVVLNSSEPESDTAKKP